MLVLARKYKKEVDQHRWKEENKVTSGKVKQK